MSATRFHFLTSNSTLTPSFDAGWEQTGGAFRKNMVAKTQESTLATILNFSQSIPITTTQDILNIQFISNVIPPQKIIGTVSLVVQCDENATTNNATLAVVVKAVSQDGGIDRGTLFSTFNTDTEFPLTASKATRIVNAQVVTTLTTQPGDRIVVEIGAHAAGPTASGSYNQQIGNSAASDYALTSALTTNLNPWIEFSQDLFATQLNNYQFVKVGDGMSTGEKIR